jgi:hypothetical protein
MIMKRVFISFRHEDKAKVNGLRLLAANPDFNIEFYDESVRTAIDSVNATYIKSAIKQRINRTSVTVCMVSELTHTSQWVDWELDVSLEKGNDIIFMGFKDGPSSLTLPALGRRLKMEWWLWDYKKLAELIGK